MVAQLTGPKSPPVPRAQRASRWSAICRSRLRLTAATVAVCLSYEVDKRNSERRFARRGAGSPIEFRLDPASGVPTYLQLVHQVEHALRLGYLKPGDQLPKVREAVASLAINPNTVLKAYRELEMKGLAAGRPGQGTFIEATLSQVGAAGADGAPPVAARLGGHRRRGGAGRGRDRGAVHQRAAGFS